MLTDSKQQQIFEISLGNLQAVEFATADDVEAKVEEIRATFELEDLDIYEPYFIFDLAADKFEEIYNIDPNQLKEILGN